MNVDSVSVERKGPSAIQLLLMVVGLAVFTSTLTGSMVNVMLSVIRSEFGGSPAQIGWVVTGYSLAYAVGVPLYGRISDLYGVRRVFAFGLAGFAIGGLICAFAPTLPLLVLGRTVQGIGGAAIPALASVAVAKVLPPGSRGVGLGVTASSVGIGTSVGPIVGGTLGQWLGWRALFIGSLLLVMVVLPFSQRVLPTDRAEDKRPFDLLGGVLLGLGAGLFLFGITQGQSVGFDHVTSWGSFIAALVAIAGFVWRINSVPDPFVSPALFKNRAYVTAMMVGFLTMLANISAFIIAPLLVVEVNNLSPGATGLVLTPGAIALALLSPFTGRLSDRVGVRPLIITGLVIMATAYVFISTVAGASPFLIAAGMVGAGIGSACLQSPLNNAAANALSQGELGSGMGLFAGAFFLGGGTGSALIGALLTARQNAGGGAFNPLYGYNAAPFSDAFLAMAGFVIVALMLAFGLRSTKRDA
jgi:MFS transporter, DHA2 family, metal-tetracycline-proton antiporter